MKERVEQSSGNRLRWWRERACCSRRGNNDVDEMRCGREGSYLEVDVGGAKGWKEDLNLYGSGSEKCGEIMRVF